VLHAHDVSGRLDAHHQAVVPLPISSPTTGAMQIFPALIDTGANASGISQRVVDSLGLGDDEAQSVMLSVRTVAVRFTAGIRSWRRYRRRRLPHRCLSGAHPETTAPAYRSGGRSRVGERTLIAVSCRFRLTMVAAEM